MAEIKPLSQISEKYGRVTPQRTQDYVEGVQNPKTDWAQATQAAEARYQEGVQKAIQQKRFGKGVQKAGTAAWQERAVQVGPNRFAEGVAAGVNKYEQGFAPYAQTIQNTTLPPRFSKGDPRNIDRVKVMSEALRKKKEQG